MDVGAVVEGVLVGDERSLRRSVDDFSELDEEPAKQFLDSIAGHASSGNEGALRALIEVVDRYRLADGGIRRVLIAAEDVDEAHQDVLVALARSIGGFRAESSFRTWLFAVARNTAAANLRRELREAPPTDEIDQPLTGQQLSSMIATRTDLQVAVEGLPPTYRDAVVLRDVQQLPYAEVASRLGVPINTVKSRISRGRALVASSLAAVR